MKPIKFKGYNVVYAENQPEYLPLPAYKTGDPDGRIICCWELSLAERIKLLFKGKLWHHILTFNQPPQPQMLEVDCPLNYK